MSEPSNTAAWLNVNKATALEVKPAPYPRPKAHEIVVHNHAVAINPVDWLIQSQGTALMYKWLKYPTILGSDCAGEVVEVGSSVTRFKVGDRVIGMALGTSEKINNAAHGAFQLYTVLLDHMVSAVPATLSYEEACVIPLGVSTAACALFQKDHLALRLPPAEPTGRTVLIWGGSTSVGCNAIQLAVAAGYDVLATASPRNFEMVKKLGANRVFDYRSTQVVQDIIKALDGQTLAGAMSIGPGSVNPCLDILGACRGDKVLAIVTYPVPKTPPTSLVTLQTVLFFMLWTVQHFTKCKLDGIRSKFVFGDTLANNEVGKAIYQDFLPAALAKGSFVPAPRPTVIKGGLEKMDAAFDMQKKGVSAAKVVVPLD
jgi:NADPH:quinone reductase-like Zn-dependent oxidoreductase